MTMYRSPLDDRALPEASDEARVDTAVREYAPEYAPRRDEAPADDAT